jgi:molecular chaperone HscB
METCWSCTKAPGTGAFCAACGIIQPERPQDVFTVLGLPARFDLDAAEIERRYRELQRTLHPDRFATRSAAERRMSLARATTASEAHRTLRDPVRRAEALLRRAGKPVPGEERASAPGPDPAFLMEVMEVREALDEARTARDARRVEVLAADVRGRRDATLAGIASAFEVEELDRVGVLLGRLRYYTRFLDEVTAFEEAS